jgi:DNA (cytosine-5)-methyltransferase 1
MKQLPKNKGWWTVKYNLLDLFSGIGGFHQGLAKAGMKFNKTYFSEIDKYAIANYKYNHKGAEYAGSVTTIFGRELRKSESEKWIVTFGFPCQDISLAGKRKGFSGDRSSLFFEAIRIIRELRPTIFIAENVKGIFSSQAGRDFATVLRTFADLRIYDIEWQLLNTRWFLPQNRERVYFIGHLRGASGSKVFPIRKTNSISAQKSKKQQSVNCLSCRNVGQYSTVGAICIIDKKGNKKKNQTYASTLTAGGHSGGNHSDMDLIKVGTWRTHKNGQGFREVKDNVCPTIPARAREDGSGQPVIIQKSQDYRKDGSLRIFNDSPTLRANMGDNHPLICKAVLTPNRKEKRQNGRRFKDNNEPMFTLTSQDKHGVQLQDKIRRLTPIECERLQGFEDNWTKYGIFDGVKKEISDTQRYKMCGNAVTVDVVEAIAKKIKAVGKILDGRTWQEMPGKLMS